MLWVDKYRPRCLAELCCHPQVQNLLQKLSSSGRDGTIPHLLFYGPSGGGKKTRMVCLMREIFGDVIFKLKADTFVHKESGTDLILCQSPHHIQISCPSLGNKDRAVIQGVLKELQAAQQISFFAAAKAYRIYLLTDAEALSDGAQAGLRRTVEKYAKTARVFLHVNQLSKIIPALRSRCLCIRVPLPKIQEIRQALRRICDFELITPGQASDLYLDEIAKYSRGNLRRAILVLENAAVRGYPLKLAEMQCFPWEDHVDEIATKIMKHQSPMELSECRDLFYELLTNCIPAQIILERLVDALLRREIPPAIRQVVITAAASYSHTMSMGDKPVFHLEAFAAQVMSAIKQLSLRQ